MNQESSDDVATIIKQVQEKGVRLWQVDGELRYRAPAGSLAGEDIQRLKEFRQQIITFLQRGAPAPGAFDQASLVAEGLAPLAPSQQAYLNYYRLHGPLYENRSVRLVASAMRLHGSIDADAFQKSVAAMIQRHEALRVRVVFQEGVFYQGVNDASACSFKVLDLTRTSPDAIASRIQAIIDETILEPIDVAVGPLSAIRLIELGPGERVLFVAMDHLIADGTSIRILMRDLLTTYLQTSKGRASLPPLQMQILDYARWRAAHRKQWMALHGKFWHERLAGARRVGFPEDADAPIEAQGWGRIPVTIGRSLKNELRDWCRTRRTTLVMSVLTAYAAVVLRWCNASECVFQYVSNGRAHAAVENAIGCFASPLQIRIQLDADETFGSLMERVTEEYCLAYEHQDFSYITSGMPRTGFIANSSFNWTPLGSPLDVSDFGGERDALRCSPVTFVNPVLSRLALDTEPGIQLHDAGAEVHGHVFFPLNRFTPATMDRFSQNLLSFLKLLVSEPDRCVTEVPII